MGQLGQQYRRLNFVVGDMLRSQIEVGFVDRHRLIVMRRLEEQRPDFVADALVLGHIGRHHHRIRTQLQRLEHRHRRARAGLPRQIARRRHHPPPAGMPDDQRAVLKRRVITLFDRRIKRITIDMSDVQRRQFTMPHDSCAAATRTIWRCRCQSAACTAQHLWHNSLRGNPSNGSVFAMSASRLSYNMAQNHRSKQT